MLAEGGVDDAHVEEDLGRVGDSVELQERLVELIVVVPAQGRYPRFYFLRGRQRLSSSMARGSADNQDQLGS